ncbi:MAG: aldehyde ferredoxin oxidoreductase family protein [Tissierellales bacterium]|nr:aldehyde ferredoxin oxidoreductase family protein [Tissierellales bacterium]MBN2826450.1 aldehyde ferredoxin oxidoreductase family protein [Tissierellales bacterium]
MYGFTGKILEVNLKERTIDVITISEDTMRKYMGGKGLISYFMMAEHLKDVNPLSDGNILYYMTGIMTGIPNAGTSRLIVGAKSPVTNGFGMSESGGFVATELKKAGWDGIIFKGKSETPVYLNIKDEKVEIRDATHLWGKRNGEVNRLLKEEVGDETVKMSQIGPAGENKIRYACMINDLKHASGRSGMGAVMGAKNLKAIVVKGTNKIQFKNEDAIMDISKWYAGYFKDNPLSYGLYLYGTAGIVNGYSKVGTLPTRNFRYGSFEAAEKISGETMADTILIKREGCFACPVRCKRTVQVDNEKMKVDPKFGGPEYETIGAMGSMCAIGNLEVIAKAHEICNDLGLDTISAGGSISFAMECFEKGMIDKEVTQGLDMQFGNEEALLVCLEDIAYNRNFGKMLAQGVREMSHTFGSESKPFSMHVKGQELPMHDPRSKTGVGLGYSVSPTGADHMQAAHDTMMVKEGPILDSVKLLGITEPVDPLGYGQNKAYFYAQMEKWWSFLNMAGVCFFIPAPRGSLPLDKFFSLLNSATGWDVDAQEALEIGERGIAMARLLNASYGVDTTFEDLPERLYQPIENGAMMGQAMDKHHFQAMRQDYFKIMGWDSEGKPTNETLDRLKIEIN